VQEGRGDETLLLVRSDNSEAAHRWLAMVGEVAVGVEQSRNGTGGGKKNGRKPSTALDKDRPGMGSGDDWHLRALRRERGHRTVTGSVASGAGPVTGVGG
jgi:hypothetical protein